MQNVSARMIEGDRLTAMRFNPGVQHLLHPNAPTLYQGAMHDQVVHRPPGILDLENHMRIDQQPRIADLSTPLGIERRLVDNDLHLGTFLRRLDQLVIFQNGQDSSLGLQRVIPSVGYIGLTASSPLPFQAARACSRWWSMARSKPVRSSVSP